MTIFLSAIPMPHCHGTHKWQPEGKTLFLRVILFLCYSNGLRRCRFHVRYPRHANAPPSLSCTVYPIIYYSSKGTYHRDININKKPFACSAGPKLRE